MIPMTRWPSPRGKGKPRASGDDPDGTTIGVGVMV